MTLIQISVSNGTLKADELKKLNQCIREIQQNDPERQVGVWIKAPELTVKEMEEVIDSKPGLRYRAILKDGIHG